MESETAHNRPPATTADLRLACGIERGVTFAALIALGLLASHSAPGGSAVLIGVGALAALVGMRLSARLWVAAITAGRDRSRIVSQFAHDGAATAAVALCGMAAGVSTGGGIVAAAVVAGAWITLASRHANPTAMPFADTGVAAPDAAADFAQQHGFPPANIVVDADAGAAAQLISYHGEPFILLAPDIVAQWESGQIVAVVAHELAHFVRRDLLKATVQRIALHIAEAAVTALTVAGVLRWGGEEKIGVALAAGAMALAIFEVLCIPLMLALSRRTERRAHAWAMEATGDVDTFVAAMIRLHERLGGPPEPSWWSRLLICEHPSIDATLQQAARFGQTRGEPKAETH